jgi:hypothetical protein
VLTVPCWHPCFSRSSHSSCDLFGWEDVSETVALEWLCHYLATVLWHCTESDYVIPVSSWCGTLGNCAMILPIETGLSLNRAYICFGHALKLVHALYVSVLASALKPDKPCHHSLRQMPSQMPMPSRVCMGHLTTCTMLANRTNFFFQPGLLPEVHYLRNEITQ